MQRLDSLKNFFETWAYPMQCIWQALPTTFQHLMAVILGYTPNIDCIAAYQFSFSMKHLPKKNHSQMQNFVV